MDLARKILSDTPFEEVNLLNELGHMARSCGQTDAPTSTSTSTQVLCLCPPRVPGTGPLLPGSRGGFAWAGAGDARVPTATIGSAVGDLPGKEAELEVCRHLGKLGQNWKVFGFLVFLTRVVIFL